MVHHEHEENEPIEWMSLHVGTEVSIVGVKDSSSDWYSHGGHYGGKDAGRERVRIARRNFVTPSAHGRVDCSLNVLWKAV